MTKERQFPDLWLDPADDPRVRDEVRLGDERATLAEFLRTQRLTFELKCSGLTAGQLATRSVPPSQMSLLGLLRHLTEVERAWFRRRLGEQDVPYLYRTADGVDTHWAGALGDDAVVAEAWRAWRAEVGFAERYGAAATDLGIVRDVDGHGRLSMREILVHMIEEYARHNGHADLLRERLDGRTGE